ncbi:uncharacterized protein BJ171DRAFT_565367 [Polychytrium aggregatum]|uniref:uncharacterized protein n=1 Tax=Polychytrium aggregatum TaxID=110093 RepID=UPI0022FEA2A7|nr:uncharacterized protein BJ171DRAFT_565367 [Polychytrium aggregatum]KAI9208218.1 hypothetical protein BJ171DRAFT_565367 [Polychytrium aggregatum]
MIDWKFRLESLWALSALWALYTPGPARLIAAPQTQLLGCQGRLIATESENSELQLEIMELKASMTHLRKTYAQTHACELAQSSRARVVEMSRAFAASVTDQLDQFSLGLGLSFPSMEEEGVASDPAKPACEPSLSPPPSPDIRTSSPQRRMPSGPVTPWSSRHQRSRRSSAARVNYAVPSLKSSLIHFGASPASFGDDVGQSPRFCHAVGGLRAVAPSIADRDM